MLTLIASTSKLNVKWSIGFIKLIGSKKFVFSITEQYGNITAKSARLDLRENAVQRRILIVCPIRYGNVGWLLSRWLLPLALRNPTKQILEPQTVITNKFGRPIQQKIFLHIWYLTVFFQWKSLYSLIIVIFDLKNFVSEIDMECCPLGWKRN
jgi:hypothetical protein